MKVFQMDCQKHFTKLQKSKKYQSEIKPTKIGKRPGTTILHIMLSHNK